MNTPVRRTVATIGTALLFGALVACSSDATEAAPDAPATVQATTESATTDGLVPGQTAATATTTSRPIVHSGTEVPPDYPEDLIPLAPGDIRSAYGVLKNDAGVFTIVVTPEDDVTYESARDLIVDKGFAISTEVDNDPLKIAIMTSGDWKAEMQWFGKDPREITYVVTKTAGTN